MSGRLRAVLTALAVATLIFSVVTLAVRTRLLSNLLELVIAIASPYVPLVALLGLALSALSRRILLSLLAVMVVAASVAMQAPWYFFGQPADLGPHVDIRVLSSNIRLGRADPSSFVSLARESADVIAVSELTPEAVQRFSEAGIHEAFPYTVLVPAPGAAGIGLWSRFPLSALSPAKHMNIAAARLQVPGVQLDPLIASVHVTSPVASDENSFVAWRSGVAAIDAELDNFASTAGPAAVIVAGDFNSTPDMRQFRDLLTNGYRDAVQQTGAGFAPTFPSDPWIPKLLTIDHVLTRNAAAAAIHTVKVPGSDHRALLATVKVPLDPTASSGNDEAPTR